MTRLLVALFVLLASLGTYAQMVHIKIINGKTGQPLKDLEIRVELGHINDRNLWKLGKEKLLRWDNESYDVPTAGAPLVRVSSITQGQTVRSEYEVCTDEKCDHGEGPGTYSIADILNFGTNTLDARRTAMIPVHPGVLTLYVRKITWLDRLERRLYS